MTNLKKHYSENTKWQAFGDLAIVLIPIIQGGLAGAPISDNLKFWIGFTANVILVAFKFFAKQQNYLSLNKNRIVRP